MGNDETRRPHWKGIDRTVRLELVGNHGGVFFLFFFPGQKCDAEDDAIES
jgi:hypothetical protein